MTYAQALPPRAPGIHTPLPAEEGGRETAVTLIEEPRRAGVELVFSNRCRAYAIEQLGDPDGVLVVDETGFVKKGAKSAGVARQYSGTAGRVENCQIGVFLAYASRHGHALIDRALYLPEGWSQGPGRRAAAAIPEEVAFATKPTLALGMIERALGAGVPCSWVLGDEIYGSGRRLRMALEQRGKPFVLAVRGNEKLWPWLDGGIGQHAAAALAAAVPAESWQRLSAGAGSKGERLYDWARLRLARLQEPPWDHWLLIRRNRKDPEDLAYFVVFGPAATSLATLARVAGRRWIIEECFEAAKQETGLDGYEIRSWHGWHRHITLAMLALAFLAVLRAKLQPQKGAPSRVGFPAWCRSACRSFVGSSPTCGRRSGHPIAA